MSCRRLMVLNFWDSLITNTWKFHFLSALASFMIIVKIKEGWAFFVGRINLAGSLSGWLQVEDAVQHQLVWWEIYPAHGVCKRRRLETSLETRNIFWTFRNRSHHVSRLSSYMAPPVRPLFLSGLSSDNTLNTLRRDRDCSLSEKLLLVESVPHREKAGLLCVFLAGSWANHCSQSQLLYFVFFKISKYSACR